MLGEGRLSRTQRVSQDWEATGHQLRDEGHLGEVKQFVKMALPEISRAGSLLRSVSLQSPFALSGFQGSGPSSRRIFSLGFVLSDPILGGVKGLAAGGG